MRYSLRHGLPYMSAFMVQNRTTLPGPGCLVSTQAVMFIYNTRTTNVQCNTGYGTAAGHHICVCVDKSPSPPPPQTSPPSPPPSPPPPSPPSCNAYTNHDDQENVVAWGDSLFELTNGAAAGTLGSGFTRQVISAHTGTWNQPLIEKCCAICNYGAYDGTTYTLHSDQAGNNVATNSGRLRTKT